MSKYLGINIWDILAIVFVIIAVDAIRIHIELYLQAKTATHDLESLNKDIQTIDTKIKKLSAEFYHRRLDTIELPPRINLVIKDSVINDTIVNVIWRFTEKKKIIDK